MESSDLTDMAKRKTIEDLFKGRHFEREIIIFFVRWCLRFRLSSRDLVAIMTEGIVTNGADALAGVPKEGKFLR